MELLQHEMDITFILNLLTLNGEFLPKWMPRVAKSIKRLTFYTQQKRFIRLLHKHV